jgi:hypothetical protein
MGQPTPVITKLETPSYKNLVIETSDGLRYQSDLSSLAKVYCFPANESEWKKVSVDSYGIALIWSSRFEVHVDQVIGLATKSEKLKISG